MAKPTKLDPIRDRLPLEVEHRVNWLNLNPPRSPLKGPPDESRVVSVDDYKLVTILNICVFEWNSTRSPLLLPPWEHRLNLLDLVWEMVRNQN